MIKKELLINKITDNKHRIAVLKNGQLENFYVENIDQTKKYGAGNIYKAKVVSIEPSMQAAFLDLGNNTHGFLHISDLHGRYFHDFQDIKEHFGRKISAKQRPPIEKSLKINQELIVQITKEAIGDKSPVLTTYISIPGRFFVLFPYINGITLSQKITDEKEKKSLLKKTEEILKKNKISSYGFLARTAANEQTKTLLQKDLTYLTRLWKNIISDADGMKHPGKLYTEPDLIMKIIRDTSNPNFERIITDDKANAENTNNFLKIITSRKKTKVYYYKGALPLFHVFNVEKQINTIYERKVSLPSGGNIVIEPTEALVSIDVNSGNAYQDKEPEIKNFLVNQEAADVIARQIKLRDLGGIIICDFIDMNTSAHKKEIEKRLRNNLKDDTAKTKILNISEFGILEMQRQRLREPHKKILYTACSVCGGSGVIKKSSTLTDEIFRKISVAAYNNKNKDILIKTNHSLAENLFNNVKSEFQELEKSIKVKISIEIDTSMGKNEFEIYTDSEKFEISDFKGHKNKEDLIEIKTEHKKKKKDLNKRKNIRQNKTSVEIKTEKKAERNIEKRKEKHSKIHQSPKNSGNSDKNTKSADKQKRNSKKQDSKEAQKNKTKQKVTENKKSDSGKTNINIKNIEKSENKTEKERNGKKQNSKRNNRKRNFIHNYKHKEKDGKSKPNNSKKPNK